MKKPVRRLLWVLPAVLLALFAALSLLANAWLESAGGKGMLERAFSSSLGYQARLTGDYRVSLFPWIAIDGSGFELELPQVPRLLARAEHYSAAIELLPFLHREVVIASVALRGGFIDLGAFVVAEEGSAHSGQPAITLPSVKSLSIEDFSIVFRDEANIIALRRAQLNEFEAGREAQFELDASWFSTGLERAQISLQGGLQVEQAGESARLGINNMQLKLADNYVAGLSGAWLWNRSAARIEGDIAWAEGARSAAAEVELSLGELTSGRFRVSYLQSPDSPSASAEAHFTWRTNAIELVRVNLDLAGQAIAGAGCYRLTEPTGLHLSMAANALDLDAINAILPPGVEGDSELPVDLAITLRVRNANYLGAAAQNMEVKIGSDPDCEDSVVPAS